ncbi:hypothetical protein P168DRAFT_238338 [Aspergillus campestris IBT 28561]|uniref:Autophagy-related protein 13 n=1 Tax=Aspergillus campestris (strain IBT 28561) TaxID=1392248 RepID=A0A2I1D084_ASPC2|nr:uncharacterized protein P168DRAFT_238338 [Aspergillus campestris IBT 28561]PKY03290.1 hypothetical protein P168DRAFT_238338 [Aspergillus campestris IBT 28561]
MHQHPRSPAPASAGRSNASRSEDRREQGFGFNSPTVERPPSGRGLGIETDPESSEHVHPPQPSKDVMAKLNQIISNYHTKAALIILHSRVDLPPSFAKGSDNPKVNRWFNVEIDETDVLREQLRTWRACDATENRPPPLIIETYLDTKGLTNNQSLVVLDDNGKRWDVLESLAASEGPQPVRPPSSRSDDVILERWRIELGEMPNQLPTDLGAILPTVYKKSIVLFRSLFTYSKFLPAWKFKRNGRLRANPVLRIKYRVLNGQAAPESAKPDHLTAPLYEGSGKVVDNYSFGVTESPAGPFSVQVTYRTTCDFRVDDSEALLSSRFMGADDEIFRPSLPTRESTLKAPTHEIGSAPLEKRSLENPDPSQAYGSLSTFHQVGPTTSTSPISALRAARDAGAVSPSPPGPSARAPVPVARASPAGRAAVLANEASPGVARRPSISFQPFKAPPLSASPSLTDPPLGGSPRSAPVPRVEPRNMPPPSSAAAARRTLPTAADNPIAASNSASPRPASISRYSSAFSHRRGRLSLGGGPVRMDDDASSGKASATSSAQPGSGLLAEPTGTSADSIHADDENISEFLKMLDLRKDLMSPSNPAALEASARRTTATSAALARFQRMRDSNAALSDSMSSSLLLQRSSNSSSKQLSGVPPMVAGTSVSTASSPGKPISPHTPHTPAIPSRLSSNSIVDYNNAGAHDPTISHVEHGSPGENPSDQTSVIPIDIPTSPPRLFPPTFRRSSSAAHRPAPAPSDEDDIFPFNLRSISLGAEDRSNVSLSVLQRQHDYESATATAGQSPRDQLPSPAHDEGPGSHAGVSEAGSSHRGSGPSATPHHVYQSRFGNYRRRGSSGAPHSFSSGSGSLARGGMHPPYLAERFEIDRDGNGSGSNSGTSTMEGRGTGRRSSAGRHVPPPSAQPDDDENLLFAMSDYSASRRSLEEGRHFNPGPSRRF